MKTGFPASVKTKYDRGWYGATTITVIIQEERATIVLTLPELVRYSCVPVIDPFLMRGDVLASKRINSTFVSITIWLT